MDSVETLFVWDSWLNALAPEELVGVAILVGMALVGSLAVYVYRHSARVGMKSMRALERELVEDAIVTGIENSVFDGTMSRKRARHWYRIFSDKMKLEGLRPGRKTKLHTWQVEKLKEEIRSRLSLISEQKTKGAHVLPLPVGNGRNTSKVVTLKGARTTNQIKKRI